MTFHQLRVFLAVARRQSYSRAAEELFLSQPAVSAQVRELERTLDATFFERVGRTIVLTEAGNELLVYAERICTLVDEARLAMQELDGLKRGRIALAAVSTAGASVLPSLLGAFQKRYPGISINLEVTNRTLVRDRLLHNEVDLVVMGRPPEEVSHVAEPFLSDEFVRQQGVKLQVGLELGDNSAVKEAVAAGLGIALLSRHVLRMELTLKRLVVLDVQGLPLRRQWFVVHREDKHLSRAAIAFKAFLLTSAEAVLASPGRPHPTKGRSHR